MKELPESEIYEKEFKFFPWGILIKKVIPEILKNAKKGSKILDLMCGPGYLLGKINKKGQNLQLTGLDLDKEFIRYAKKKYSRIKFIAADALKYKFKEKFDLILITAGLHHLPYSTQEKFIKKVSSLLEKGGKVILADPFISNFKTELQRKKAAAELGYEYLKSTLSKNPPEDMIEAAIDIMANDINKEEYKNSKVKIEEMVKKDFKILKFVKTWPKVKVDYGEGYWILKKV